MTDSSELAQRIYKCVKYSGIPTVVDELLQPLRAEITELKDLVEIELQSKQDSTSLVKHLIEVFVRYGKHDEDCDNPCTCGLATVLKQMKSKAS